MSASLHTALYEMLKPHFSLGKHRMLTLVIILLGLVNSRTVNLSHIASQFLGAAKHASNYRRLQRFFQYIQLDQAVIAPLVRRMLGLNRPVRLALDRTNWQVGSSI